MNAAANTVTLTLARLVTVGAAVTVAYTKPATGAAIQDDSGNQAASTTKPILATAPPDTAPPVLGAATVDGDRLVLTYNDANHLNASDKATPGAFAVLLNRVANPVTDVIVNAAAKTVTLMLTTAVRHGDAVTVAYTDPSATDDRPAIQDTAGNDAASFAPRPVSNLTPDTTPPQLVTDGDNAPAVNGNQLVLHYADTSNLGAVTAATAAQLIPAFAVRVNGAAKVVTEVAVDAAAKTVTLTLATAVTHGQKVAVAYTDPTAGTDANAIRDASGNHAATFPSREIINRTPDVTPPSLVTTGANAPRINGHQLVLNYTDASDLATAAPPAAAFTVRVNTDDGTRVNAVERVTVDAAAKTVTLTLAHFVTHNQNVTASYADPGAIQDTAGNDAASFPKLPVTNNSPRDTTAPVISAADITDYVVALIYTDETQLEFGAPPASAFRVLVNGTVVAVTNVDMLASQQRVMLTLERSAAAGDVVTVDYTKPPEKAIRDLAGNQADSFTGMTVRNVVDNTTPELVVLGADAPKINGDQLVLTYADANILSSVLPALTTFTVLVDGQATAVTGVTRSDNRKALILTLATAVRSVQEVTISYTDPNPNVDDTRGVIQDMAGNDAASFQPQRVINNTPPDTTPPALVTTGENAPKVNGDRMVLTYTKDLGTGTAAPPASAFKVLVKGNEIAVASVAWPEEPSR